MDTIQFNSSFCASELNCSENEITKSSALQEDCNFGQEHTAQRIAKVLAYCVIIAVSTLGNSAVIAVIWRDRNMRKLPFNVFVVNLATADLVISLVYMSRTIVTCLQGQEWLVNGILGLVLCKTVPSLHAISILVSVLTLLAMAADRFLVIVFPLRKKLSLRSSKQIAAFIWLLSLAVRIPYIYSLKTESRETTGELRCVVDVRKAFGNSQARKIYYTSLSVVFYGLPFVAITSLYSVIIKTLRQEKTQVNGSRLSQETLHRASRKLFCMLLAITAAFVICWLTYFIAQVVHDPIPCSLRFWRLFLAHVNSSLNPLLYAVFNDKFRHGYKRLLHSCLCC